MYEEEMSYVEKIFKESEIATLPYGSEDPVLSWVDQTLCDMIRYQDDGEHSGYYKISIVRFNLEEFEDYQERHL